MPRTRSRTPPRRRRQASPSPAPQSRSRSRPRGRRAPAAAAPPDPDAALLTAVATIFKALLLDLLALALVPLILLTPTRWRPTYQELQDAPSKRDVILRQAGLAASDWMVFLVVCATWTPMIVLGVVLSPVLWSRVHGTAMAPFVVGNHGVVGSWVFAFFIHGFRMAFHIFGAVFTAVRTLTWRRSQPLRPADEEPAPDVLWSQAKEAVASATIIALLTVFGAFVTGLYWALAGAALVIVDVTACNIFHFNKHQTDSRRVVLFALGDAVCFAALVAVSVIGLWRFRDTVAAIKADYARQNTLTACRWSAPLAEVSALLFCDIAAVIGHVCVTVAFVIMFTVPTVFAFVTLYRIPDVIAGYRRPRRGDNSLLPHEAWLAHVGSVTAAASGDVILDLVATVPCVLAAVAVWRVPAIFRTMFLRPYVTTTARRKDMIRQLKLSLLDVLVLVLCLLILATVLRAWPLLRTLYNFFMGRDEDIPRTVGGLRVGLVSHLEHDFKLKHIKTEWETEREWTETLGVDDFDEDFVAAPGSTNALAGLRLCFTGTLSCTRKDMHNIVRAAGGGVCGSVSHDCTHLVMGPGGDDTIKHRAALARGVPIMDEAWLWGAVNA